MQRLRRAIDILIYFSVLLGVVLLPQIYPLVPSWLFYSVLAGWFAYLLVAIATARHLKVAYPLAFLLSILTLVVSLPQPEHYSFEGSGMWLAAVTFMLGSAVQIAILVMIAFHILRTRREKKGNQRWLIVSL